MHIRIKAAAAAAMAALAVAGCGNTSRPHSVDQANAAGSAVTDASVKSDLTDLLDNGLEGMGSFGGALWQVSTCVHQSGNEYQCSVWKGSDTRTVAVTDDGTAISEQGVGKGE
jgi:hypothetical protein